MAHASQQPRPARADRPGRVLSAITALSVLVPRLAAQAPYHVGAPPDWVQPIAWAVPAASPSGQVTQGFEMLLIDRQEIVRAPAIERFRHVVYRLLDEGAVQQHSQIEIVFDSSFEQLTLHAVTVIRNGRPIDQLGRNRIRVVQRESRLDYQIYDGSLSLVLLLEDVRRGDVVAYSYTRRGTNPVFRGHYRAACRWSRTFPCAASTSACSGRATAGCSWPGTRPSSSPPSARRTLIGSTPGTRPTSLPRSSMPISRPGTTRSPSSS